MSLLAFLATAVVACGGVPLSQSLPNIAFDVADWSSGPGVVINTMCHILGNASRYEKATLVVPLADLPRHGPVYFVLNTSLHGVQSGAEAFDAPKIKICGKDNPSNCIAQNLDVQGWIQDEWVEVALEIMSSSHFAPEREIVFEISMQNAVGEFFARSPRLQQTRPPPSYAYPFAPPKSSNVGIKLDVKAHAPFPGRLLSANSQFVGAYKMGLGYDSPAIQGLLKWLDLPQLRFPGGTVGNYYDWHTDSFYPNSTTCGRSWPGQMRFDFDGFVRAMAATNATAVLMFNVIEDSVESSVARLVNRSRTPGLHIDWIELGNENYDKGQSCGNLAPHNRTANPQDYIAFTSKVVAAFHDSGVDPLPPLSAPLDATGLYANGTWNHQLISRAEYDGFVMHPYVTAPAVVFSAATAANMLQASAIMHEYITAYAHVESRPLSLTEYGILGPTTGTFLQSLSEAAMFLAIVDLRLSHRVNIVQAGLHILFGGTPPSPSAMFGWDQTTNATVASPTGVWYRKMVEVLSGANLVHAEVAPPMLPTSPPIPGVVMQAATHRDGRHLLVGVNKLNVNATLTAPEVSSVATSYCSTQVFTQPPLSWNVWPLDDVDAAWHTTHTAPQPTVQIPPLSIFVVWLC